MTTTITQPAVEANMPAPAPPAPPALPQPPAVPPELQVLWPKALLDAPVELAAEAFARSLRGYARRLPPEIAKRFVMAVDSPLYEAIDATTLEAFDGVHPKHELTRYHDFFVDRIDAHQRVLDLGCGYAMVACSIAQRAGNGHGAQVVGVDWSKSNLDLAHTLIERKGLSDRLSLVHADIITTRITGHFDVIVISNILEHLAHRAKLLRTWQEWYAPKRILVRVPAWDRDWRVPLKDSLGIDSRTDPTHETEYTEPLLRQELDDAGLSFTELISRRGEYWAVAEPRESE